MPSQRETQLKPANLIAVGGVNQRIYDTELPPDQYSNLDGVWPEFAGLQSRQWGKRLLALYPDPIMGIFQFWTPQGYGVGLYQFEGNVDFGYWLTPSSKFDLTPLALGTDFAGMTLDDFGGSYGSNFGYGTDNACVISFLEGSSDHSACLPTPSVAAAPDDSNGGPAGQGKRCRYETVVEDRDLIDYTISQVAGSLSNIVPISDTDNCRNDVFVQPPCVPFPALPQSIGAIPEVATYTTQTINGVLSASKTANTAAIFTPASNVICFFRTTINQGNSVANNRLTCNLASMLLEGDIISVNLVLTKVPGGEEEIPLTISEEDMILNANDYLTLGAPVPNVDNGFNQSGSVSGSILRVRSRQKVCT